MSTPAITRAATPPIPFLAAAAGDHTAEYARHCARLLALARGGRRHCVLSCLRLLAHEITAHDGRPPRERRSLARACVLALVLVLSNLLAPPLSASLVFPPRARALGDTRASGLLVQLARAELACAA